jgi:hypothetical protein
VVFELDGEEVGTAALDAGGDSGTTADAGGDSLPTTVSLPMRGAGVLALGWSGDCVFGTKERGCEGIASSAGALDDDAAPGTAALPGVSGVSAKSFSDSLIAQLNPVHRKRRSSLNR